MKNKLDLCVFKNEYTSSQMCSERVTALSFCEDDDGYAVNDITVKNIKERYDM